jgi:hypothetical protein
MWSEVIPLVCQRLETAGIRYHADASSSLFVQGLEFEMDDFDITVDWSSIEQARSLFMEFSPTEITGKSPKKFEFSVSDFPVDVLAYESETGIGPELERVQVNYSGIKIWSKKPEFYLSRMKKDHPLRTKAIQFFRYPM